jgi:hypothetical protein
MIIDDP